MYPLLTFIVLAVRDSRVTGFLDDGELFDTRKFYKVFYVTSGSSAIGINDRVLVLDAGEIIFQRPGDRLSFQISEKGNAYLCLVHTEYLSTDSTYLLDLFRHFPLYHFHRVNIALDSKQSEIVRFSFESILMEQTSNNPDKKQATVLHLQMILLQIQRAGQKIIRINAANSPLDLCWLTFQPFSYS